MLKIIHCADYPRRRLRRAGNLMLRRRHCAGDEIEASLSRIVDLTRASRGRPPSDSGDLFEHLYARPSKV